MRALTALAFAGLSLLSFTTAFGQTDTPKLYLLQTGSSFQTGCFGPCLCPVLSMSMQGTFGLRRSAIDPLFTTYDVLDVRWTLPDATQNVSIVGSGTYRIGGEFALQHQMVLDLSVAGGPTQRFDSGLVAGGGEFPEIEIRVSLHQEQACIDTVLYVRATPASASSAEGASTTFTSGIRAAAHHPFQDGANLVLTVARAGQVEVAIFDPRGRSVRRLVQSRWMASGEHPISWDGKSDDGDDCAAGVYLVRARIGGGAHIARIVRVR